MSEKSELVHQMDLANEARMEAWNLRLERDDAFNLLDRLQAWIDVARPLVSSHTLNQIAVEARALKARRGRLAMQPKYQTQRGER